MNKNATPRGARAVQDWAEDLAFNRQPFGVFQVASEGGYSGRFPEFAADFLAMKLVELVAVRLFLDGRDPRPDANHLALTALAVAVLGHTKPDDVPTDPVAAVRWIGERVQREQLPLVLPSAAAVGGACA